MWLFIAFLSVPLIEIALFIQVGGFIGLWPTLLIVVVTAVVGTILVRAQGAKALSDLQAAFSRTQNPAEPLAHGAMILFSGALLLTPGFFTDAVGFALLVPGIREHVLRYLRSRIKVQSFEFRAKPESGTTRDPNVVEGDYEEIETRPRSSHGPSGWTRH